MVRVSIVKIILHAYNFWSIASYEQYGTERGRQYTGMAISGDLKPPIFRNLFEVKQICVIRAVDEAGLSLFKHNTVA